MSFSRIVHAAMQESNRRALSPSQTERLVNDRLGHSLSAAEIRAAGKAVRRLVYPVTRPPKPQQQTLELKP